MPTWGELLQQLQAGMAASGQVPLDEVRRAALAKLHELTGRPTVLYASRWMSGDAGPDQTGISIADLHALMEVLLCQRLPGRRRDAWRRRAFSEARMPQPRSAALLRDSDMLVGGFC